MKTKSVSVTALIPALLLLLMPFNAAVAGSLVAWEWNYFGQCNVPAGQDYEVISAGYYHNLALKFDGSLAAWGYNAQGQCNVPAGNDYTAIAAGSFHSLALKTDGTIVAWGSNDEGQCSVPVGTYTAIAAGSKHSLAICTDGSLAGWGWNDYGQSNVPAGTQYAKVAAGRQHSLALRKDGSLVAWGRNDSGQSTQPAGNNYDQISAGENHCLALKTDGSIAAWGSNVHGQCDAPAGNDFVAVSAGSSHSLALKTDGSLVAWGWNNEGQCNVPAGNDYGQISAGGFHNVAILKGPVPNAPSQLFARQIPGQIHITWQDNSDDETGFQLEYKRYPAPFPVTWKLLANLGANVTSYQMHNPAYDNTYVYRVAAYNSGGNSPYSNEFSIKVFLLLPRLVLEGPDGQENLAPGSVYPITWENGFLPPDRVTIEYSTDGGSNWLSPPVAEDIFNREIYYWRVPQTVSDNCIVKLRSATSPQLYDLSNHPFSIGGFDFDHGSTQGWTLKGAYDEDGYGPFASNFIFGWKDPVDYPNTPGSDPTGDGQGSIQIFTLAGHGVDNPGADWWIMQLHSPDLSGLHCWQNAHGFSVRIAECMAVMTSLYANLNLHLYDLDQQKDRYFYSGTAQPLTHCVYNSENIWNHLDFNWSAIPAFPHNYIVRQIYINIFGPMDGSLEGGLYLDNVMPMWPKADFSGDGAVNMHDVAALATAWLSRPDQPYWSPAFDLHHPTDNNINLRDFAAFANNYLNTGK